LRICGRPQTRYVCSGLITNLLFPKKQGIFAQGDTADAVLYPRAFGDMQPKSAKADRAVDGFCRAKPPQPLHIAICRNHRRGLSVGPVSCVAMLARTSGKANVGVPYKGLIVGGNEDAR